jgi:hypothetical protein
LAPNSNAGIAQLVERNLAKVEVAGSSPVSRSKEIHRKWILFFLQGAVAKRSKAKVCKTFIRRFESDRRLNNQSPSSLFKRFKNKKADLFSQPYNNNFCLLFG